MTCSVSFDKTKVADFFVTAAAAVNSMKSNLIGAERPSLPTAAPQWCAGHVPAAAGRGIRLPQTRLHGGGASHGVGCVCVYVFVCGPVLRGVFRCAGSAAAQ